MDYPGITYDFGVGGYDIEFRVASLSAGKRIGVVSKMAITTADAAYPSTVKSYIYLSKTSVANEYSFYTADKQGIAKEVFYIIIANLGLVRIVVHDQFATIYVDDKWVHTFVFEDVYYSNDLQVSLVSNDSITVYDIRLKELSDWRDAIFVDMETTSQNAIGSAILQRPVNVYPDYLGRLIFEYNPVRDQVELYTQWVREHSLSNQESMQSASDAVVYFTNAAVVVDEAFARNVGFVTRMYRFPDLDSGAIQAAQIELDKARKQRKMHTLALRLDPRICIGDIVSVSYTQSGTSTLITLNLVVESISVRVIGDNNEMVITGRDNLE